MPQIEVTFDIDANSILNGAGATGTRARSTVSDHPPRLWRDLFFFFNDTATTEIYTLSLHAALPIPPTVAAIPANTQNANTIFIVTPARITIVRFHTGCRSKARAGSMGTLAFPPSRLPATPSSSSPAIFT